MSKRRNAVARDLRTPKYRLRIVPDKRKAEDQPGITYGDDDSIGKQMVRQALNERWYHINDTTRLRVQTIDGVDHWDYFAVGRREE